MRLDAALDSCSSFAELNSIAEKATPYSTCLGRRRTCVTGYDGSVAVDAINARLMELVKANPNYNEAERAIGKSLTPKITKLYLDSDQKMSKRNCITQLFCIIIDCLFYGFHSIRWNWEWDLDNEIFDRYSPAQKAALAVG